MALVWRSLRALETAPLARLALGIGVFAGLVPTFTARPWMVSFLLLALLTVLEDRRGSPWAIGLLLAVWINLHGMFVLGFVWVGVQGLARVLDAWLEAGNPRPFVKRTALAMAVGASGALLHPSGPMILLYPLEYHFTPTHETIVEWYPPDTASAYGRVLVVLFAVGVVLLARGGRGFSGWLTLGVFGYLAFTSRRNIPLFWLSLAPMLAQAVRAILDRPRGRGEGRAGRLAAFAWARFDNFNRVAGAEARSAYWVVVLVLLGIVFLVLNPGAGPADEIFKGPLYDQMFPVEAAAWLTERPDAQQRRIFNFYAWGGWMIREAKLRPFIDGRADLYGLPFIERYHAVMTLRSDWPQILEQHRIDTLLVPARHPVVQMLTETEDWTLEFSDPTAAVLFRSTPLRRGPSTGSGTPPASPGDPPPGPSGRSPSGLPD